MSSPPGSRLENVLTWIRRIIKVDSSRAISDETLLDYLNRFYLYDVPARVQLFELKRQYTFTTVPNVNQYNFPFYPTDNLDNDDIPFSLPGYQIVRPPIYCDGVQIGYFDHNDTFYNAFPQIVRNEQPIFGDGTTGPYSYTLTNYPLTSSTVTNYSVMSAFRDTLNNLLPGIIITAPWNDYSVSQYIVDDIYSNIQQTRVLNQVDSSYQRIIDSGIGTFNNVTGVLSFQFQSAVPVDAPITIQTIPYQASRPIALLFYNNILKLAPVPDRAYTIQFETQITPASFLNTTGFLAFDYMSEYLARGAARKILADTGDTEQMQFLEPLFREQEVQVLRRTNRQQMVTRTPTIFSGQFSGSRFRYFY